MSVLVGGERHDRDARSGKVGVKREIAQDSADVERHMGAVHNDGQASWPHRDIEALHAPGETRGQACVGVEERRADWLA